MMFQVADAATKYNSILIRTGVDFKVKSLVTQTDSHHMESSIPSSNPSPGRQNEETTTV